MPTQTIIWTVLPNGVDEQNRVKLSVFISPRLNPPPKSQVLQPFPDFMDWPATINKLLANQSFTLVTGSDAHFTGQSAVTEATKPNSQLWQALFNSKTPVNPFVFDDPATKSIFSFPSYGILKKVKETYTQAAKDSPSRLLNLSSLDGRLQSLLPRETDETVDVIRRKLEKALRDAMPRDPQGNKPATLVLNSDEGKTLNQVGKFQHKDGMNFYLQERFYQRSLPAGSSRPKKFDFHEIISALTDYPVLLRRLGLVVDLVGPDINEIGANDWIKLVVNESLASGTEHVRPATHYQVTKKSAGILFTPRPRLKSKQLVDGALNLTGTDDVMKDVEAKSDFFISQVDLDGAAMKLKNTATTISGLKKKMASNSLAYTTPNEAGLPSLQSAGITLLGINSAADLAEQLGEARKANSQIGGNKIELFAEDLVSGYRVDVQATQKGTSDILDNRWRPLYERSGSYSFTKLIGRPMLVKDDPGYVKSASVTASDAASNDWYLHEAMFSWDGWSQCVQRPGRRIMAEEVQETDAEGKPVALQTERPQFIENQDTLGIGLSTSFKVTPGTLPKLRFGWKYKLRVRTVDLAGNSVEASLLDPTAVTNELQYGRFEPVPPPVVLPQDSFTEGESSEHMVIRSNDGQSAEDYAKNLNLNPEIKRHFPYKPQNARLFLPPKTSQLLAETHGKFDKGIGTLPPEEAKARRQHEFEIAARESLTIYDIKGAKIRNYPGVNGLQKLPPAPPSDLKPFGEQLAAGQYVVYPENEVLKAPYLPDPLAKGVAFRFPAGIKIVFGKGFESKLIIVLDDGSKIAKVPFTGDWPNLESFQLMLAESSDQSWRVGWDAAKRILAIGAPKAASEKVQYSSYVDESELQQLGIWKWASEGGVTTNLKNLALGGAFWMITPARELRMTHAVQQPLSSLLPTDKDLLPKITALAAKRPATNPANAMGQTSAKLTGKVKLSVNSSSRLELLAEWDEWVDDPSDSKKEDPKKVICETLACELPVESYFANEHSFPVTETPPEGESPANENLIHEFGDTKHRKLRCSMRATTKFREYLPPEITGDAKKLTQLGPKFSDARGKVIEVSVPSSAPPAAPKVAYIIPTFKWTLPVKPDKKTVSSTRVGGGLRVYLERPWYSSGDGELLGVVLLKDEKTLSSLPATRWGQDPLWSVPAPATPLKLEDFTAKVQNNKLPLKVAEAPAAEFSVAGHPVDFDPEKKLWFSDIEIAVGDFYLPFIKLALARFQPNSISGVELSPVVLTDFIQLVPTRTVEVVSGTDKTTRNVKIIGTAPSDNKIQVTVETRDLTISDEDFGWTTSAKTTVVPGLAAGSALWQGKITLPTILPTGGRPPRFRLVVKEFEMFTVEGSLEKQPRLVYADAIEL